MKKIISMLIMIIICLSILPSCRDEKTDLGKDVTRLTKMPASPSDKVDADSLDYGSIESFSEKLSLKLLEQNENTNIVFSPLSAYLALAMVKEGAEGETLEEMNAVMGNESAEAIYTLISYLTTFDDTQLNISNSVWIDLVADINPKREYLDTLADFYLAECYKTVLSGAESDVNKWISESTNGMIENMLDETALDESVMALVNAIYMNAHWENEFDANNTHKRDFQNSDGNVTKTDFMYNGIRSELIIETDAYIGVVLRYKDTDLNFVAVMPTDETASGTDILEAIYSDGGWRSVARNAEYENARLYLPTFEYNTSLSLTEILQSIGIKAAFSLEANFDGIDDDLVLDSVLQNAAIKLYEDGTEASAATVVTVKATGAMMPEDVRTIEFNRPFVFSVVDSASGVVIFAGEYNTAE